MLKKTGFKWTQDIRTVFKKLKQAITSALVLSLPNFEDEFVVETDTSETGVGAMLLQREKQ